MRQPILAEKKIWGQVFSFALGKKKDLTPPIFCDPADADPADALVDRRVGRQCGMHRLMSTHQT